MSTFSSIGYKRQRCCAFIHFVFCMLSTHFKFKQKLNVVCSFICDVIRAGNGQIFIVCGWKQNCHKDNGKGKTVICSKFLMKWQRKKWIVIKSGIVNAQVNRSLFSSSSASSNRSMLRYCSTSQIFLSFAFSFWHVLCASCCVCFNEILALAHSCLSVDYAFVCIFCSEFALIDSSKKSPFFSFLFFFWINFNQFLPIRGKLIRWMHRSNIDLSFYCLIQQGSEQ